MEKAPNENGIVNAMKSMQTIASKGKYKGGLTTASSTFPRPPIDFVGTVESKKMANTSPTIKTPTTKKKTPKANKKKKSTVSPMRPPPPPPMPPIPLVKPDTNSQLFGTLVNSLKTGPVGQTDLAAKKNTKSKQKKKKKKGYASSSSSSSVPSVSTSSSSPSSISSGSSQSSSPSDLVSSGSSGSFSSAANSKKLARETKKRKDELLHEKVEMLTRIANLSKNGFATTKSWDVKDDIDEIRYECYRMQRESNSKKSIKIMRRVLVTITTLVETGNSYFNPFNLRLDGFSESMMLNLDDYDDCFEQIHHKYSGRSSVGPEMQILFTFMSAAIFHHAGNAIGQNRNGSSSNMKKSSSASPMSSVMSMIGMLNPKRAPSVSNYPVPRSTPPPREATGSVTPVSESDRPKRKTMRGPGASSIPESILGNKNQTTPSMTLPSEPEN